MIVVNTVQRGMAQETETWKRKVLASGGRLRWDSAFIANNFINAIKNKSYYRKIVYLMPFLGTNFLASIVPLIDAKNFGVPTNVNFVDADFTQSTGLQGNASNKYLTMPFTYNQLGTSSNGGGGFWCINVGAGGTQYAFGISDFTGANPTYGFRFGATESEWCWGDYANRCSIAEFRANHHYYGNRSGATSRAFYKNGISVATNTTSDSATNISLYTPVSYALNNGSILVYWGGSKGVEYYTDGTFSSNEAADFHSMIKNYLMAPTQRAQS